MFVVSCWSALTLRVVIPVALVLGSKSESRVYWAEEHLGYLDPVAYISRRQECLQLAAAAIRWGAFVEPGWHVLQQPNRDVAALEGEGLAQESAGDVDSLGIGAPMGQAILGKLVLGRHLATYLANTIETLCRRNIPFTALCNLGK